MCTVTWLRQTESYHPSSSTATNNGPASRPGRPSSHESDGVRCLYPVDCNAGGTWLGVNEHGLTIGVLNHYSAEPAAAETRPAAAPRISRGLLVVSLLGSTSEKDFSRRLATHDPRHYAPFILFVISRAKDLTTYTWNRRELHSEKTIDPHFLTTSSFDAEKVASTRRECFLALTENESRVSLQGLTDLHASQQPEPGPYAICMERDDARTLSFSRVDVTPESAFFSYANGPPSTTRLGDPLELQRGSSGSM